MENVSGWAALWIQDNGERPRLEVDKMQSRSPQGTRDWKQYGMALRVSPHARSLDFGVLMAGTGEDMDRRS